MPAQDQPSSFFTRREIQAYLMGFSSEMALQCLDNIIPVWFPAPPGYSSVSLRCRDVRKCGGSYQILKSLGDVNALFT